MDHLYTIKRLQAADELLRDTNINRAKYEAVRNLLIGLNPKLDQLLAQGSKHITQLEELQSGILIETSADQLPENTQEQKQKKRLILLFIQFWKDLQKEVTRVQAELEKAQTQGTSPTSTWPKIIKFAKGPLGFITAIAVVVVALQSLAVTVTVTNNGCDPIDLSAYSYPFPGIQLPKTPINDGDSAIVKLPPLSFTFDATDTGNLNLSLLGFNQTFRMPTTDLIFNGTSLMNQETSISLGQQKKNQLLIKCN